MTDPILAALIEADPAIAALFAPDEPPAVTSRHAPLVNPPTPTDPYTRRHVLAQAAGDAAHEAAADADKSLAYMHAYQHALATLAVGGAA